MSGFFAGGRCKVLRREPEQTARPHIFIHCRFYVCIYCFAAFGPDNRLKYAPKNGAIIFGPHNWTHLGFQNWAYFGSQNGAQFGSKKWGPKWGQHWPKIDPHWARDGPKVGQQMGPKMEPTQADVNRRSLCKCLTMLKLVCKCLTLLKLVKTHRCVGTD